MIRNHFLELQKIWIFKSLYVHFKKRHINLKLRYLRIVIYIIGDNPFFLLILVIVIVNHSFITALNCSHVWNSFSHKIQIKHEKLYSNILVFHETFYYNNKRKEVVMAYVKKPRKKIKWKIAVPLLCLCLVVVYLVVSIFLPRPKDTNQVQICDYDSKKTELLLNVEAEQTYQISDYFFYGENLSFLKNTYTLEEIDELYGKTIQLKNLCNGEKILFQLNNTIDQQINLGELNNGFYEVYVINNLQEYRLTATEPIEDVFHTITRNQMTKKVEVIATDSYLKDITLNQNYVYLNVTSDVMQQDSFDVLIDPFGGNNDYGTGVSYGYQVNGLSENDEMYKAALALKKELESYGLVVGITKDNMEQHLNTNGEGGRAYLGYQHNAKLFINLQFNGSDYSSTNGIEITRSYYSSSTLANQIIHDMEENVGLMGSMLYPGTIQNGVVNTVRVKGDHETAVFDPNSVVRETGGVATGAGSMNAAMREANAFAAGNKKGMQSLMIRLIYVTNPVDYKLWMDNYEGIMSSLADSIAKYYQLEKEGQ